jgi:hypothetical protein
MEGGALPMRRTSWCLVSLLVLLFVEGHGGVAADESTPEPTNVKGHNAQMS